MINSNHPHQRFFLLPITFFATLLISIAGNTVEIPEDRSNKKIAFLFLTRGPLPLEDIWREFFRWRGNSSLFTVYAHPHHGYRYPSTSFFHGKEVHSDVGKVKWGGLSQVCLFRALDNFILLPAIAVRKFCACCFLRNPFIMYLLFQNNRYEQ